MQTDTIKWFFQESADIKIAFGNEYAAAIWEVGTLLAQQLQLGKKVFIAGNGGSAADAQHRAAELTGRYKTERQSLGGIALTTDTSALTAIGNDYGFDHIFAKQLAGLAQEGDIFVGISTSGNSANIIEAVKVAKNRKITTLLLLGKDGGKLKGMGDWEFIVPSDNTPRIQECHQTLYHTLCEIIDEVCASR